MAQPIRSGIPTSYAYSNFRSRLEARWAAFFDLIGWRYVYEPLDAAGYIPDFLIHGKHPLFVEVGPCITQSDFQDKARKPDLAARDLGHDLLIVGVDALAEPLGSHGFGGQTAGWLGEYFCVGPEAAAILGETDDGEEGFVWNAGLWSRCGTCGLHGIAHAEMSYHLRPCGHYPGGHIAPADDYLLKRLWAEAGNVVQWHAA